MTKDQKIKEKEALEKLLNEEEILYLADISGLNALETSNLRRLCFKNEIELKVVKNKLLKKAMESVEAKDFEPMMGLLKGNTALFIGKTAKTPAKIIKEYRKKKDKPLLKGAYIESAIFIGDGELDALTNLKSKEELVADIIALLQSPIKNVVSSLQSGGSTISGLLKTLENRG